VAGFNNSYDVQKHRQKARQTRWAEHMINDKDIRLNLILEDTFSPVCLWGYCITSSTHKICAYQYLFTVIW